MVRQKTQPRRNLVDREIRRLQRSTKLCIPQLPFSRLVRCIQQRLNPRVTHWQASAIGALHEAVEMFMVHYFEDAYMLTRLTKRVTLQRAEFVLLWQIYKRNGVIDS